MASDDFNRADAGNLGGNWTNWAGSIDIVSNQAKTASIASEVAYYTAASAPSDQYSQVVAAGVGANAYQSATVRTSDVFVNAVSGNLYGQLWAASGAGQGLYKFVNGTASLLQSITGALSANDVIKTQVSGTTIKVFKNGVQQGTDQTDGSLASGSPGIGFLPQNGTLSGIFDNWQGGALSRRFILVPC